MLRAHRSSGFTLVEVLVAVALFIAIALGVAQLIAVSTRATLAARQHTSAVVLAAAKMDQLRSLAWSYEQASAGVPAIPRSDRTTDVSHPDNPPGGPGLSASPIGTLATDTPFYADYLDGAGRWVGRESPPPESAVFVRRWAVHLLPGDPERTLVLRVLVTTIHDARTRTIAWSGRSGGDALLVSVRTRKGQ